MVCGVGLGSEMAINGASAHAFCHILYKALLFMGAGAVIHVTGYRKMTDLYGKNLYRKIPITLTLYMVGAFSISGVPLFNGFISKTMVVAAAGALHRPVIESMLHLASVGTWLSVGLKLPWGTWFAPGPGVTDDLIEVKEPPLNMLIGMGFASFLCVLTGIFPNLLYRILTYAVDYHPYTASHVVATLQLLLLTVAGFWFCLDRVMAGKATLNLDTDWFYRTFGRAVLRFCQVPLRHFSQMLQQFSARETDAMVQIGNAPMTTLGNLWKRLCGQAVVANNPTTVNIEETTHRFPMGLGVLVSLVFLFVFGMVYFIVPSF
jgi:multicomponent Na+:H+ antiporter subunit D